MAIAARDKVSNAIRVIPIVTATRTTTAAVKAGLAMQELEVRRYLGALPTKRVDDEIHQTHTRVGITTGQTNNPPQHVQY